jgi:hypothetical protein
MFSKFKMEVNKKVEGSNGNEYQKVGEVEIHYPRLDEFGIQAAVKKDENGQEMLDDTGVIVYEDQKADYLMSALVAYIKMNSRNKLVPGTVELRDGAKIPSNWEEFLAESTGRGEALKIIAEAKKAWASYVNGLEKKPEIKNAYIMLFGNKQGLTLQPAGVKSKFSEQLAKFAETLEADSLSRYQKYLTTLEEACQGGDLVLE